MATPSVLRTCSRCFRSVRDAQISMRSRMPTRRGFQTATPLFLDFLAPSWQAERRTIRTGRPAKSMNAVLSHSKRAFSQSTGRRAVAIQNPRSDDSGAPMLISITPRAADRLQTIAETDKNPDLALRVSVESGGCHGFQYLMSLTSASEADAEEDTVFENEERVNSRGAEGRAYKAKVVIDEPSLELLKGSSVDYTMELIGSQFKVTGIPGAKSSCGCGTSFDIAA